MPAHTLRALSIPPMYSRWVRRLEKKVASSLLMQIDMIRPIISARSGVNASRLRGAGIGVGTFACRVNACVHRRRKDQASELGLGPDFDRSSLSHVAAFLT